MSLLKRDVYNLLSGAWKPPIMFKGGAYRNGAQYAEGDGRPSRANQEPNR